MKLKITDLIVEIDIKGKLLADRIGAYIYNGEKDADIVSIVSDLVL